jgi:hypothetical protein
LIGIKGLLELNVNEAPTWRLTSVNPDRGTKDLSVISFLCQCVVGSLFNDAGKPYLYDCAFDWEIFFIPAGTNRLKASLRHASLRT